MALQQMTQEQHLHLVAELEIEMMSDMYNKMMSTCQKKCISPQYKEGELTKGESVCLDRCVAKYLDIHDRIGKRLTQLSQQDESLIKQQQQQPS